MVVWNFQKWLCEQFGLSYFFVPICNLDVIAVALVAILWL